MLRRGRPRHPRTPARVVGSGRSGHRIIGSSDHGIMGREAVVASARLRARWTGRCAGSRDRSGSRSGCDRSPAGTRPRPPAGIDRGARRPRPARAARSPTRRAPSPSSPTAGRRGPRPPRPRGLPRPRRFAVPAAADGGSLAGAPRACRPSPRAHGGAPVRWRSSAPRTRGCGRTRSALRVLRFRSPRRRPPPPPRDGAGARAPRAERPARGRSGPAGRAPSSPGHASGRGRARGRRRRAGRPRGSSRNDRAGR